MSSNPQRLYTAAQARELDRIAIEEFGLDGYGLMQRAGLAAFRLLRCRFPRARRVRVYCGSGNNGGDGYVLAALALKAGLAVRLAAVGDVKSDAAGKALAAFRKTGGLPEAFDAGGAPDADVVIDALLGTGLDRPPAGDYGRAIEQINEAGRPVLAMDIPSGLHADTGAALQPCVRADATATFIGRKLGCFTADGRDAAGVVHFDDLGVPGEVYQRVNSAASIIDPHSLAARVRARPATAHKGDAGRVLIVGGNRGMPGAPCMAARAAHRSGAGLVYLATRSRPDDLVGSTLESMAAEVASGAALAPLSSRADVIAVGPGLGRDDWAAALWQTVLEAGVPMVVDADALSLLADNPHRRNDWILTPHPGEAARLLGTTAGDVQRDRVAAIRELRRRYGGVIVLKGPGTLVLGRSLHLCDRGNPGMASGGMGDVLTGVIAALRGQGLPAEEAACYGVWCHGLAGDRAARRGVAGLTAGDLTAALQGIVGEETERP
ncbi:MAG: NAD(P)H-hydrate dehydratase [Gammaproteobacteria bacterium]|nr:NAD(P)H-hydrate dehydratase [Gammaproteobacteria bacterium]